MAAGACHGHRDNVVAVTLTRNGIFRIIAAMAAIATLIGVFEMGYSEKTENYELPLYLKDDRPTYLGDWNETMSKIDGELKSQSNDIVMNETSIVNMKTYVDDNVGKMDTEMKNALKKVDEEIAGVDTTLTTFGQRITAMEDATPLGAIPRNGKVVCIGDSWLEGYTQQGNVKSWGTILGEILDTPVYNFYKGGAGWSKQSNGVSFNSLVDTAAVSHSDADLVIITGGINDRDVERSTLKAAAKTVVQNARAKFPDAVIWCFVMPLSNAFYGMETEYRIKAIEDGIDSAACKNVAYDSLCWTWLYDDDTLCSDLYHPTADGQNVVAEKIAVRLAGGDPTEYTVDIQGQIWGMADSIIGYAVRTLGTCYLYVANTTDVSEASPFASVPLKYNAHPYFGVFIEGNTGDVQPFNIPDNWKNVDGRFGFCPAFSDANQVYATFTWTINDNR